MNEGEVLKLIEQAEDLPTLPTVAARVVDLTVGTGSSVKEVANLIEKDVALSTKILQVINSPFYGFARGITSVSEAVSLMGFKQVGNLALGISVMSSLPVEASAGFGFEHFWERSVNCAVAAVMTTARVRPDISHSIFTTALLQDIGAAIVVRYLPVAYGYALGMAGERKVHPVHGEREVMATDHAEVGAVLAEKWNLPPAMHIPIRYHHFSESQDDLDPSAADGQTAETVKLIQISNLIVDAMVSGEDGEPAGVPEEIRERVAEMVGLEVDDVAEIVAALPDEIERVRLLFRAESDVAEPSPPPPEPEVEVEEETEETIKAKYFKRCPECGSEVGVKFCGNCGGTLLRMVRRSSRAKRYKVLVAEDSDATRTAIGNLLKRMGYDVSIALNGEEAVEMARAERPDLILMDIMMPVMDGIEALRRIRGDVRLRTTPIVMLTSVTDVKAVTEAIESGANDYIAKPFSVTLLTERVERYVHAR